MDLKFVLRPSNALIYFLAGFLWLTTFPSQGQTDQETWMVIGPISVFDSEPEPENEAVQKEVFNRTDFDVAGIKIAGDSNQTINDQPYKWQPIESKKYVVSFDEVFGDKDFVYAYAYLEIEHPEAGEALLGIGSDDAVKVWLNDDLVHENWVARAFTLDEDLVTVNLKAGKNKLLLKIQDKTGDWKFSCRLMTPELFSDQLAIKASIGDLDAVELLLTYGADINAKGSAGLTPLQVAQIKGRTEIVDLLKEKGADSSIELPKTGKLINFMFESLIEADGPGAAVMVAKGGDMVYQKGFGLRNIKKKQPITMESEFRIGSITKQFTAAAILKLQEAGKLSVKDPLSKFVPDFPKGDEITIHQLLTHISGIRSYTGQSEFIANVTNEMHPDSLVKIIAGYSQEFDPGTSWNYNNSAYFLLGHIVGKVSEQPYGDYLHAQFFAPLGMTQTGVYTKEAKLNQEALGYSRAAGTYSLAMDWDMSWAGAAGNLYSIPEDLLKWNNAIFEDGLLQSKSMEAAFTPVKLKDGSDPSTMNMDGYGYGWAINQFRGTMEISHGGGLHGFLTYLAYFPDSKLSVVVLTNCSPGSFNPAAWARQIAEYYLWDQMEAQASFALNTEIDPESYKEYIGRYEYPGGAVMVVTEETGHLYAQLTGQPRFEIFPSSKDAFFWKVVEAQINFERDASGSVVGGLHKQGGSELKVPKIEDVKSIELDPSVLVAYQGTYQLNPTFMIEITSEGSQLFAQATGQPKFELFPISETEFALKAVVAQVDFIKDDQGTVTHLILHQANMEQKADKIK